MARSRPVSLLLGLAALVTACTPPGAAGTGPAAAGAEAPLRTGVVMPTARVRLEPAAGLDRAAAAQAPARTFGDRLVGLEPGHIRLRRPVRANGLYLSVATPEMPEGGAPIDLLVEGAAPNPTDGEPIALNSVEAAPPPAGCGAIQVTSPVGAPVATPAAARRKLLAARPSTDEERFWVIRPGLPAPAGAAYDEVEVATRRVVQGERCNVYLDALITAPTALAEARALADAFDRQLAPAVTRVFGPLPAPGLDGEPKVFLVLTPQVSGGGRSGVLAYFARRDQRPRDEATPAHRHSNERDVLFIEAGLLTPERRGDLHAAVAHELQHLIHFTRQAPRLAPGQSEALWLEEALATYASHVAGYTYMNSSAMYGHVAGYFARAYKFSLTDWPGNPYGTGYGMGYLFMAYLAERFGDDIMAELAGASELGKANLEARLRARGSSFRAAFAEFAAASVNDGLFEEEAAGPYRFKSLDMRVETPFGRLDGPASIRLGPEGVHIPRRADVAYLFHVKPVPGATELIVRGQGPFLGLGLVP